MFGTIAVLVGGLTFTSVFFVTKKVTFVVWLTIAWVVFVCAGNALMKPGSSFHLHHWTIGLMGMTYLSYPHWMFAILHGLCCGLMIDGGARWGFDPIWVPNSTLQPGQW
jgi:hypothetical protein